MAINFWISTSSTDPSVAGNWSTGSTPVNGDDIFIVPIPGLALANIAFKDMSAVTLNSLTISAPIQIGTTDTTGGNFFGYWKISASTWTINGSPTRVKINFGSVQFAGNILATGSSADADAATVRILGTHASNAINMSSGSASVAANLPGEASTIFAVNINGQQASCTYGPGVTWTSISAATSASITVNSGGTTATASSSATITIMAGNVATANAPGGTVVLSNRPSSGAVATTANASPAGTIDFSQNPAAGTVTTLNLYGSRTGGGRVLVDPANSGAISFGAINLVNAGTVSAT